MQLGMKDCPVFRFAAPGLRVCMVIRLMLGCWLNFRVTCKPNGLPKGLCGFCRWTFMLTVVCRCLGVGAGLCAATANCKIGSRPR